MKKTFFVLFTTLFLLLSVATAKPDIYFQAETFSLYPWRNLGFAGGTTLYGEISHRGFALGIFQYTTLEGKKISQAKNDEMDFILSYRHDIGDYSVATLLTEYNLPSSPQNAWLHSWEIGLTAEYGGQKYVTPGIEYYYDLGRYDAGYIGGNITFRYKNTGMKFSAGVNDGQWTEGGKTVRGFDTKIFQKFKCLGENEIALGIMQAAVKSRVYMTYKWSL